jgi:transposase
MVRRIDRLVDELDLSKLEGSYSGRGARALPPRILLKAALMEVHSGEHSPARWWIDVRDKVSLQWLCQGLVIGRSQWYRFRDRLAPEQLIEWNALLVQRAQAEDQGVGRHGSVDGTAMAACASRHHTAVDRTLQSHLEQLTKAAEEDAAAPLGAAPSVDGQDPRGTTEAAPAA